MSKPPHKIELPQLDDLFDDTFERNARRVLSAAERLEEQLGDVKPYSGDRLPEQEPQQEPRPEAPRSGAHSLTALFGSLLLGIGIIAVTFTLTLFALNSYSGKAALALYVWPIGLSGQVFILIGFWLRSIARNWANRPNQGDSDNTAGVGGSPFGPTRWDQGHALPALPERARHGTRAGQRQP